MLPQKNRLHRTDFSTLTNPKTYHSSNIQLSLYSKRNKFKAAVIVSKKVSTQAVHRNRLRRAFFSVLSSHFKTQPPVAIVVRIKPSAKQCSVISLKKELLEILGQISV